MVRFDWDDMEPGTYGTDTSGMARAHGHIEAALGAAPEYVRGASNSTRVAAVATFYENILEYVQAHHGSEDAVLYPRLEDRCADERDLIGRVGSQHRLLEEPMAVAVSALARWREEPTEVNATALVEAFVGMSEVFGPHCRDEEDLVMPIASRYLSPDEWHEMLVYESQHFPLGYKRWVYLGLALERADDVHRAQIMELLPERVRAQWDEEWSSAYQTLMADVRPASDGPAPTRSE